MNTFLEIAVHSVYHMFSLVCIFVVLVVSNLGFMGGNLVLIVPVTGHCFPFTFYDCSTQRLICFVARDLLYM